MITRRSLAVLVLLSAAVFPLRADDCIPAIESGWVRQPPMAMPMMAGFATIRNACDATATVVSARSPAFASVELHETTRVDGVSRMRHVEALALPARGEVKLAPGGLHLMLMRPQAGIEVGDRVDIELELADGRKLQAEFEVRAPNAR
ncbi:MAG TPA: copper chaperone PCu(A)C [Luteimonas sp.]|nr:copper chaperone PCu(A)C [Luteimonas sp.]HRO26719.1 copper chaperone PCu(A)C [Luteimonas sp.]HRP73627.1 copper chaperone PCu(A)C [Luteimonas sp.]